MADKEDYIIEGTVTEISSEKQEKEVKFKISGTEGFAIKKGKTSYNLLWSTKNGTNETAVSAFILFTERTYKTSEKQVSLLSSALTSGKRVRITIKATENEIKQNGYCLHATSVSLLSD
ncbi:hypothetical protein [Treponema sp.]|uniref:hypothetical protein n=1 Tax=Treponema sp. TaxID=166 RepID=UPI0025F04473|nr:hypothetical protein [Treponema sp.]MBR4321672.1 hypothetical protein [Treponema sp.]